MELISDILLVAAALSATVYCIVLSRRLRRFTDLEKGVGGAIAVLSAQVDDMTKTLESAQKSALGSTQSLAALTKKAERASRRLELLVAAMHDLPEAAAPPAGQARAPDAAPVAPAEPSRAETPRAEPSPAAPPEAEPTPVFHSARRPVAEAAE